MARATFVKAARNDIYQRGKRVEYVSQKGKQAGQTLTKTDRTIPADDDDQIYIKKGESYYWWQFMNSPKQISKEQPKQSQLTQSSFLSQMYSIVERVSEAGVPETKGEYETFKDELYEELEQLSDECQDSLDNMPENLTYSPTGELLQERIDNLESLLSDIDSVTEIDDPVAEEDEVEEDFDQEDADEKHREQIDEVFCELVGVIQDFCFE